MESKSVIKKISSEDLDKKLISDTDFTLIDTLTNDHFNRVHIVKSKNACVFEVTFPDQVNNLIPEKNKTIILYGFSEKTMDAVTAAEKLLRAGYQDIYVLDGGLTQWQKNGYALEGDDPGIISRYESPWILDDCNYIVDVKESVIEWTGRNPNKKHHGTIGLTSGEISVKKGRVSGKFEIDIKSIRNIDLEGDPLQQVLIGHLQSDDFFFVKMFPKAMLMINSAEPIKDATQSEPNFEVSGDLKLRGVQNNINFPANVSSEQRGTLKIESHFDIDRTRWGAIYGSARFFEKLGMHLVFDFISIQLRILAKAKN